MRRSLTALTALAATMTAAGAQDDHLEVLAE
jgi:hypothetical protein